MVNTKTNTRSMCAKIVAAREIEEDLQEELDDEKALNSVAKREIAIRKGSRIIGRSVGQIKEDYGIEVLCVESFHKPTFRFDFEQRKPKRGRILKQGDTLTISGEEKLISKFYGAA